MLPGKEGLGGRARPWQVVAKKPHLPAMLPAVAGVSTPLARTRPISSSMRRTRTGLGRKIAPCRRSSRMTPCTAWAGAGGCFLAFFMT